MLVVYLLFFVASLVLFALSALHRDGKYDLMAAGLACWTIPFILQTMVKL